MDKETLSNYGWIVICVLVLAVMIALATPFGSYVSDAVKSTTQGLFDTNKNALNSTGLINIGDQSFSDGTDDSGGGNQTTEASSIIPNGAKYTVKATNVVLKGNGINKFPDTPATNDTYENGDYVYTYNKGVFYGTEWSVAVKDTTKTSYGEILSEIAGKPITNMFQTFSGCTALATAPVIPSSVTNMTYTFSGCQSLTTASAIPDGVTEMGNTFTGCASLITSPTIPSSVTNMYCTFSACTSLTGTIEINANPTTYYNCFKNTVKPITLTGPSTKLTEFTTTTTHNNVTVK